MKSFQENMSLVNQVCEIYEKLSKLNSLKPCNKVDHLFTQLVQICISSHDSSMINIATLPKNIQDIRCELIKLCGEAEGYPEAHFSTTLGSFKHPIRHLHLFPYYSNYLKLNRLEYDILNDHYSTTTRAPKNVAFVGSGPLPLTSIVLASYYLKRTKFHNYEIDPFANSLASRLVACDNDLSERMSFHTANIMDVTDELKEYDVIFLAALVGIDIDEKVMIIRHLAKYMSSGAILMLRSAHGARAFLYLVIDPQLLEGFDVLSVFHPDDDVINSVVISRKCWKPTNTIDRNTLPLIQRNWSFPSIERNKTRPLMPLSEQFAKYDRDHKYFCSPSSSTPYFTTETTFRPILMMKEWVSIIATQFVRENVYFRHVLPPNSNNHVLRTICRCLVCKQICPFQFRYRVYDRQYCIRLFCNRILVATPLQLSYKILRK